MERQEQMSYRVIAREATGEIVEKKSRFIATMVPVSDEDAAAAFLDAMRKRYYDARHNCYAYIIGKDTRTERSSDDGEPSGTAGRPMLEVLRGAGLTDVAAVVTRYFGGVLLGTGGLVRAYTQALQAAVENSEMITMRGGVQYTVSADYTLTGKLQHLFATEGVFVKDTIYSEQVTFCIVIPPALEEKLKKSMIELSSGRLFLEKNGYSYYEERN